MLTAITYRCNRDSLGDVSEESFTEEFEDAVLQKYGHPTTVTVTFSDQPSGVESYETDDNRDFEFDEAMRAGIERVAEIAEQSCRVKL